MPASDSLFCFTSNKIDSHFCPNCRAPMLVRAGLDLNARTFECFNCDKVVAIPADRSELSLDCRSWDTRLTWQLLAYGPSARTIGAGELFES
jgi:hypothetical protein